MIDMFLYIFGIDLKLTQTGLTLPTAKVGGFLLQPLLHWR